MTAVATHDSIRASLLLKQGLVGQPLSKFETPIKTLWAGSELSHSYVINDIAMRYDWLERKIETVRGDHHS